MANLVQSWDGWDYYSDGTAIGPDGSYYFQGSKVWEPSPAQTSDWSSGWGSTMQSLARTVVNTWSAKTLMQQNQQGQRYLEGRPVILNPGMPAGGGADLLMLLAIGAALIMLAK